MPESTPSTLPTNTLIITNLEAHHFEKETMLELKAKAESFGEVYYFAPIKSFYRVFVVYSSTFDAQQAKAQLHNTAFGGITIRVYYGQHTEINHDPASRYLHPPELEKNWLISPPGSPPVGWTQVREDPPNSLHLADDLVKALLEMGQPVYQLPRPDGSFADRSHLFEADVEHFSLDDSHSGPQESTDNAGANVLAMEAEAKVDGKQHDLHQQILGLKIDTQPLEAARAGSPHSVNSPASSLFPPATPTVFAFSPAKESEGDQPFITVQDWGADAPSPSPLKRRGTIPKTMFPTGPHQSS
ncbi:Calcipressin-domain-containing protein [Dissophora ornata]|nr:carbohydrate-binding module 1 protein [Dissophora ornata]KAI8601498.1 Calcipressin-domain-containing protein [Dissophora ornata]